MPPLLHLGVGGPQWLDWSVHIDALLLCIALSYAYYFAVTDLRPRVSDAGRVRRQQVLLFAGGILALYAAGGTPLHDLGERYLLSAHMLQHFLLAMVAAPLLLAGTPAWLWDYIIRSTRSQRIAAFLTRPIVAFGIFNAVLVLTHLPPVIDLALHNAVFHFSVHVALVATAMLMWWPILSPLPQYPRLSYPLQMGYLFLQSLLPTVIASFITFSDRPVYEFYANAPRIWSISPVDDQQIGGGLMKVLGSIELWAFIAVIFFKWYAQEQAEEQEPRWKEVEAELEEIVTKR